MVVKFVLGQSWQADSRYHFELLTKDPNTLHVQVNIDMYADVCGFLISDFGNFVFLVLLYKYLNKSFNVIE